MKLTKSKPQKKVEATTASTPQTNTKSTTTNCISQHSNSAAANRSVLLKALLERADTGLTTIEARRDLDVLAPAPRIYELRHWFGHQIDTIWTYQPTDCGKLHRIGKYIYRNCGTGDLFGGAV